MNLLDALIAGKLAGGGGGGGSVTVDDALSGSSENPVQNKVINTALGLKADASALRGKADKPTVTEVSGTDATIAAAENTIYECGELDSLTVSSIPESGWFEVHFISGAVATNVDFPNSVQFPKNQSPFTAKSNTYYEINVNNGKAAFLDYEVSA